MKKMNEYKESLDRMYDNYVYGLKQKEDSYFTLQELVDKVPYYEELEAKATPKLIKTSSYGVGFCPICNGSVWQNKDETKYCFRCGNALKWTNNE